MNNEKFKDAWNKLNPDEESRQRILGRIENKQKQPKGRISTKMLLIAAVITILSVTTVIAGSSTIREIIFGNSRAIQVEEVANPNITQYAYVYINEHLVRARNLDTYYLTINNPDIDSREIVSYRWGISSVEEANRYVPFTITEPAFVPEHLHLSEISLPQYEDGSYTNGAMLLYLINENAMLGFWLVQRYVGPDGYFNFESTQTIERVMIGDVEGLFVLNENGGANPWQASRRLMWISDGIFYDLFSMEANDSKGNEFGLDLETMIAIGESVR